MIKLEPYDVLLYVNEGKDWVSSFSRWAIGRYDHVAVYLGRFNVPMLYQSVGRGVSIQSLQPDTGKLVLIMRPALTLSENISVFNAAIELASNPQSYYDYLAIVKFCVPLILKRKFPWLPVSPNYKRDRAMICSEAAAECFWRGGVEVLPKDAIPLPSDFVTSPVLEIKGEGRILKDITV